ncbi:MAG: wax ester/triacylglycerol synthase family O-acyltransferase [Deltaproteobacteria bacterium]|jgi:WS/DGAT/MGAT family acyltransferase|nr:wax ester/triacylglycerol synthase family O-acyltransferase [Deltaproteobacteria bacterium]MBW2385206.1 wax ester/triacylglycerol synthase family O-acyltransferase [Deltaproteobacteria bacterium]MBW2696510.1 wax ester/triacylglycerol synthase family O-acyltransferase [Deltaproteobacteria bacterium]
MQGYNYERLSAQDASFLIFETPSIPMHVAATTIFEAGPLRSESGGVDISAIKGATEAILHLIPRYRQKLAWIPLIGHPVWIDDRDFNLDYHIRHTSLPRPGTDEQLRALSARVMSHQLDRARPLWETWIVEGLEGDRFAMINKLHHCMVDGSSGMDIAHVLMSTDPDYRPDGDVPVFIPHLAPGAAELIRDELLRRASLPFQLIRDIRHMREHTEDLGHEIAIRARALQELVGWAVHPPSETPLNGTLGPHRRFDWLTMSLDSVKAVRKALGCTVNDVVLTTVTGAVREFLIRRNMRPEDVDFRVSAPVSVRRDEERGKLGNRVSSWIVRLPVEEANPLRRVEAIHEVTHALKNSQQALGVEMIMQAAEWTPPILMSLGARAASGPINMIVTNVPGPQTPLYLLGAKSLGTYPMVPLLEHTGLGVALMSYDGKLCWGFNADYELIPDLAAFRIAIEASFDRLSRAAGIHPEGGAVVELHVEAKTS